MGAQASATGQEKKSASQMDSRGASLQWSASKSQTTWEQRPHSELATGIEQTHKEQQREARVREREDKTEILDRISGKRTVTATA